MSGFDIIGADSLPRPSLMGDGEPIGGIGERAAIGDGGVRSTDFSTHLESMLGEITELNEDVKNKYEALARGDGGVELHDLMTAMGKSEVAFNLMLEVRNKLVDAWESLSRSVV